MVKKRRGLHRTYANMKIAYVVLDESDPLINSKALLMLVLVVVTN
jgi:hypothetical protein